MSDAPKMARQERLRRLLIRSSLVLIAGVLLVTAVVLKPGMPHRIRLLTGPDGSAYDTLGERYAQELRRRGLEVELVETSGGLDNLRRLTSDGEDTVALAPSMIDPEEAADLDRERLVSFGSIAEAPLWLLYRSEPPIRRISDLRGLTMVTGGEGTVSGFVARNLIEENGIAGEVELKYFGEIPRTGDALLNGTVDALFVAGAPLTPALEKLLTSGQVSLFSFERAAAYTARLPGLKTLLAPEGVFDLARNLPPVDTLLLSSTTNLVALDDIHPVVAPMMLEVTSVIDEAERVHYSSAEFPSRRHLAFPLEPSARRWFERGKTGLAQYLPYKLTRFLNNLSFLVLPALTLAVLLLKLVPATLRFVGTLRLRGFLHRLETIEKADAAGVDKSQLLADLDRLDRSSAKLFVPRQVVHDYVDFRQFIHDMRDRLSR